MPASASLKQAIERAGHSLCFAVFRDCMTVAFYKGSAMALAGAFARYYAKRRGA